MPDRGATLIDEVKPSSTQPCGTPNVSDTRLLLTVETPLPST
jgi:hypothetical protein